VPDTDPGGDDLDRFYTEFARRVKAAREAAGLTQSGLERAAKVHPCTVSAIERGESGDLTLPELARIAAALRIDIGELLPGRTQWD